MMKTNLNKIHPTAIIGKNVIIGSNNVIGPYSVIEDNTVIGDNNIIGSHVVIGSPATDTRRIEFLGIPKVIIGNNNIIREFSVIEKPCYETETRICNDVFLMQGVHISHDNVIHDKVVITNQCVLGGIAKILEGADLGMGCTINQYSIIGQYCIVATGAPCMKNVKPFSRYIPNRQISVNKYAIEKYGFQQYYQEIEAYVMEDVLPVSEEIINLINEFNIWVSKYGHETYNNR